MHVILQAIAGPASGLQVVVRGGQVAQVGRTNWADFSIPNDPDLGDVHFAVACDQRGGRIRNLNNAAQTLVNGAEVLEAPLHTGDQVTAGQTTFSVFVEGEAAPLPVSFEDAAKPLAPGPRPLVAADLCQDLELSESAQALLDEAVLPAPYLERLSEHGLFPDAVRFLAFWLPKPQAVAWGCACVREAWSQALPAPDKNLLELAERWSQEPTEEHRRAAGTAAEATKLDGAAAWVAMGAFWSGGSLAAPELPPVPPGPSLTARAITGALMMAAAHGDPRKMDDRYRGFLTHGQKLVPAAG
ncbi:MAG: hypothetical protein NTY19_01945 [Planctomycetota bacterium]|nr:hypothetical protein [Planctomycetota bacterium]